MKKENIGKKCILKSLHLHQGEPFTPDAFLWFFIVGETRGWYFIKPCLPIDEYQAVSLHPSVFKVKPSEIILEDETIKHI